MKTKSVTVWPARMSEYHGNDDMKIIDEILERINSEWRVKAYRENHTGTTTVILVNQNGKTA